MVSIPKILVLLPHFKMNKLVRLVQRYENFRFIRATVTLSLRTTIVV